MTMVRNSRVHEEPRTDGCARDRTDNTGIIKLQIQVVDRREDFQEERLSVKQPALTQKHAGIAAGCVSSSAFSANVLKSVYSFGALREEGCGHSTLIHQWDPVTPSKTLTFQFHYRSRGAYIIAAATTKTTELLHRLPRPPNWGPGGDAIHVVIPASGYLFASAECC